MAHRLFDLAAALAQHRYVYVTTAADAMGAYRGDNDAARRGAARLCRESQQVVLFYADGEVAGQLTPVAGRAMWTAASMEDVA